MTEKIKPEEKTMTDFLMKPKIDYAFKEIMTDEKARKGFLSAVLKLNPASVQYILLHYKQGQLQILLSLFRFSCFSFSSTAPSLPL